MNHRRILLALGLLLPFVFSITAGVKGQSLAPIDALDQPISLAPAEKEETERAKPEATKSFFGMDMYLSSTDWSDSQVDSLSLLAQAIGVKWSHEELAWAIYDQAWGPTWYDGRVGKLYDDGFGIIGVLITTPEWARKPVCQTSPLCPPANPQDFANFAADIVERYDGDGNNDAPGSPRVDYWEIWTEPDQPGAWLPAPNAAEYTQILCAAYSAIKQADPTATVLIGGLTDWDTVGRDGFGDQVVANGGWGCFDVVSFHPYMLSISPDEPGHLANMRYRTQLVTDWIQSNGGGKPAWATGYGWSTCTSGSDCVTEAVQADYLVRGTVIIAAAGFSHADYFQLIHKASGMPSPYRECSVLREDWSSKPSYYAYGVMTDILENSTYSGNGPLHNVSETWTDRYDYHFRRTDGAYIDVVWQVQGQADYQFPVEAGVNTVTVYTRDGSSQTLTPSGGYVTVTLSESPRYIVRTPNINYSHHVFLPLIYH